MDEDDRLAERFEEHRTRLRAIAHRMLGSLAEADEAVQDTWLRLVRTGSEGIDNLGGWLTTTLARVCLNMLRARHVRREDAYGVHLPDPVVRPDGPPGPEEEAELAESVGFALLVVLDTLTPAERVAFVLHDLFDLPFDEIAPLVRRSPAATRQLASRARRRVKGVDVPTSDGDLAGRRAVVDAFFDAARRGDLDAIVAVLHPDVVRRADFGADPPAGPAVVRGAEAVARQAMLAAVPDAHVRPALVNGSPGAVITVRGRPHAVVGFVVVDGAIVEIDAIADPARVRALASALLPDP